jgi:hypothetical protein
MIYTIGDFVYIYKDGTLPELNGTYGKIINVDKDIEDTIRIKVLHWGDGRKRKGTANTYYFCSNDLVKIYKNKKDMLNDAMIEEL